MHKELLYGRITNCARRDYCLQREPGGLMLLKEREDVVKFAKVDLSEIDLSATSFSATPHIQ